VAFLCLLISAWILRKAESCHHRYGKVQ
jgi:hypothetical protein